MLEMNFPGTYLIHAVGLLVFGGSDAGGRAFDLVILAATCLGLAVALRSYGAWAVAFGALGFWIYHLGLGSLNSGQRDFVMCLSLAWMIAAAMAHVRSRRLAMLAAAAFCLGVVIWMKPTGVLLIAVLVVLAWRDGPGRRAPAFVAVAVGLAAASAIVVGWLAYHGGLVPFLTLAPPAVSHYASLGQEPWSLLIKGHRYARNFTPWAVLSLIALWRAGRLDARLGILLAGAAYSVLHYFLQRKGWEYHVYPAALFAMAIGGAGTGTAIAERRRLLAAAAALAFALAVVALAIRAPRFDPGGDNLLYVARPRAIASLVAPLVPPGETIQVLDAGTDAGIHVLYILGLRQPTRVLYDHFVFEYADDPWHQAVRDEFITALRRSPPAVILFFEQSWPRRIGYERLQEFPALEAFLAEEYRLVGEGDRFRVYARRDLATGPLQIPPILASRTP
jgi:hypothetical protein